MGSFMKFIWFRSYDPNRNMYFCQGQVIQKLNLGEPSLLFYAYCTDKVNPPGVLVSLHVSLYKNILKYLKKKKKKKIYWNCVP